MEQYTVDFNDKDISKKLCKIFRKYGVAVITGVFDEQFCNDTMDSIVTHFEGLGTGINRNNIKETWTRNNLPPQTRAGMFQTTLGHIQPVWDVRKNCNVRKIFEILYSNLREKEVKEFIVSYDGLNVIPNEIGPYHSEKTKDWAHLDQTIVDKPFLCVQGQAVLTNTTAAFRCTPGSCHYFNEILEMAGVDKKDKSNWCKFKNYKEIEEYCLEQGLEWQIPMYSPKGSFIVWTSSTIHSAKYPDKKEEVKKDDPWFGWRGVVYVCYRPREEIKQYVIKKRQKHILNNRLTNHWGEKVFPKTPGGRFLYIDPRNDIIENLVSNPELMYELYNIPEVDESLV